MVLIINRSKKEAESLATAFRYMGVVARGEVPERASAEISTLFRAILIISPEKLPDEREYVTMLRGYLNDIPFFAISDNQDELKGGYEAIVHRGATASQIYQTICTTCEKIGKVSPGEYMLTGIHASVEQGPVTYFSEPIPLTKTESLLLRFLIRTYPMPVTPKVILKYIFSQAKSPEVSSIKTHVCAINGKFKSRLGRSLIVSTDGGYVIMTPMLAKKKEIDLFSATH